MKDSIFQTAIYKEIVEGDSNMMISAVAGSGKTTTLIKCLDRIPKNATSVFLAFNNSIVNELKERITKKDVHITTMHSFCWRALMKHNNFKCELKPNKSIKYIEIVCKRKGIAKDKLNYHLYVLSNLIDLIRQSYLSDVQEIIELANKHSFLIGEDEANMCLDILNLMNSDSKIFDFTDMIYRVIKEDVILPKYDFVFVDESQDLSALQQLVISRIKSRRGRLVAVGDPMQAIYGFAGADVDSYNKLKNLFPNTKELPLSVNYRCGSNIVKEAKKINPVILPFENNPKGIVQTGFVDDIQNKDWVLCRNLKPLIFLNLYLLSQSKKSYVRGSDIGLGLIALVNKTGCSTTKAMLVRFKTMVNKECEKLRNKGVKNPGNTDKIDMMNQKLDVLRILSIDVSTTKMLIEKIRKIFKDEGVGICLSTIHKSKGLENDTVHILCPELIPSKYAEQPWELQQEENLKYVAITRAKSKLVYLDDFDKVTEFCKEVLKQF